MGNPLKDMNADFEKNPAFVSETIESITTIASMGAEKPKTAAELKNRIDAYFIYCKEHSLRPGVESLSLALAIDRRTFWTWCNGVKGEEWAQICKKAKQCIISMLETSMYHGKLNPASAIFALKNIGEWSDTVSIESVQIDSKESSIEELPDFSQLLPKIESEGNE